MPKHKIPKIIKKKKPPCYTACRLKLYRCRCGKYVNPNIFTPLGYSKLLCNKCWMIAIKKRDQEFISIDEAIENYIPFVELRVY